MADIRIKDLATTASSAASDDFMALDGATNGTRKMSAANPSVTTLTTSGVIAPGGSVHGANGTAANPSFAFLSNQNTGLYRIGLDNIGVAANGAKVLDIATTGLTVTGAVTATGAISGAAGSFTTLTANSGGTAQIASLTNTALTTPVLFGSMADAATVGVMSFNNSRTSNTMQGIAGGAGGTTLYYLAPTGHKHSFNINFTEVAALSSTGVTIASSTAGSASAGALVVTGGLSAGNNGNASYFGGAATFSGAITGTSTGFNSLAGELAIAGTKKLYLDGGGDTYIQESAANVLDFYAGAGNSLKLTATTATFAGAVTIAGTVIHTLSATPASASATGTVGTMSWDASYIYICTATNTWKRVAIATW